MDGPASITNSGTIQSSNGASINLTNSFNSTRSGIVNQVGGIISSSTSSAIQSFSPGVDVSNYGTITSPTTAISFANTSTSVSNTVTLHGGSTTTGAIQFNPNSNSETLNFTGLVNSGFNNSITGLNVINATGGAQVTMNSAAGYSLVGGVVNVDGTSALTISGGITDQASPSAASSITKTGIGILTLSGSNTYTGVTIINAGTVTGGNANAFSAGSATTINPTGTVNLGGFAQTINAVSLAGGTLTNGALTGAITSAGGTVNNITGSASLTNTSGTTTLTGANGYTGATMVNGGTVTGGNANAFSAGSATTINPTGTVNLGGFAQTINAVSLAGGTLTNGALAGAITSRGGTVNNITGAASLTNTSGTTTLTGANGYTGATTVNGGTVTGGNANAFSAGSATTINPTGTVNLGGFAQTINAVSLAGGTLTNGALTGAITSTGGTVNNITGAASLTNTSGTTTLTGANGYTDATTVNGGTVTVATGASLSSPTSIASGGTFNNNGTMTGTVNNACGGNVNNAGSISNSVTNAGALSNSGTISGSLTNNTPCGVVNNTGTLSGTVTNNATLHNNGGGTISGPTTNSSTGVMTNAGLINSTLANAGQLTNTGTITGTVTNSSTGTLTNASGGTISNALTNSGNVQNQAGALISGAVTNNLGGVIDNYSAINNTVANFGTLNLNGTPTVTGAISGTGVVNVNGTFTQEATIEASQVNVNSGGTLNMTNSIAGNTTVFGNSELNVLGTNTITGNVVNSGTINPRDSATDLNIDGHYTMTSRANFVSHIDGLAEGAHSQIISNQPISIADGSVITAALNPGLKLNPGDTVQNVIKGNGPVAPQGTINVNTLSDRYKLAYLYDGQNVDLYLPGNSGGTLQKYGERGTYYGALTEKTLWSLSSIEGSTTNALHQRYAVLNAVMSYDCNRFDKYNFCISAQARATGFGTQATGSGVFNIAYRPTNQTRIGAFLDYQVTGGSPSADGLPIATTLSSGSVQYGYNNPTFGGYLGFSQSGYNGNILNKGIQAFVSGGYNPGKLSITRAMIVDPNLPFVDSQPGSGSASLNAYFVRGMVGYGFNLADNLTLMPYVGLRYTDVTRGGYMESFNLLVTQPLVYNSYYERLVTGFGGGMLNGRINERLGMMLGLGAETDFSRSANSFSGYSPIQLQSDNLPFGFGHGGTWNGLRPTGMAGAYYDLAPNQRVMINSYAGEQAWSSRGYLTGLAGYQIAF
jgi:autotransporter-associated beta strand protein